MKKSKLYSAYILTAIGLLMVLSCGQKDATKPTASLQPKQFVFRQKPASRVAFLSTQMNPVEEAGKMRNAILKDFPGQVEFRPNDNSYLFSQIASVLKSSPAESILVGALHGDLVKLFEDHSLRPLNDVLSALDKREFQEKLIRLSRLNGTDAYYIPWMQASFVMAANKKALQYLPAGTDPQTLTYEQFLQWAKNIHAATGKKAVGFPAGGKGLMHRFFQGYLYPSYTGSTLLKFRDEDAIGMWKYFKELWNYADPGSLIYSTMAEPLLTGDVLIAWDHTARLVKAFEEKPDDFIAFPAPSGPKGRGFMAVISGLSIPAGVSDPRDPALLIDYLTRPEIQIRTLAETGFFPVIKVPSGDGNIPRHLRELSSAVDRQADAQDSVPTLMPVGLGERGGDYNNLFMLTFSEIVLDGKDVRTTLNANALELQKIIDGENAKCWSPDISDARPCKIE